MVVVALAGTVLTVVPSFSGENEYFRAPKVFALGAAAALAAFFFLRHRVSDLRLGGFDLAVGGYFLAGIVSWILRGRNPLLNASWFAFEAGAVLVLAAASWVASRGEPHWQRLVAATVGIGAVVAAVAVCEAAGLRLPWSGLSRPYSTLNNRNFVGAYAAILLPLAIYRVLHKPLAFRALALFLLALTVCLCRCRSAWLGLMIVAPVAGLLVAWLDRRGRQSIRRPANAAVLLAAASLLLAIIAAVTLPWPGLSWREQSPLLSSLGRLLEYEHGSGRFRLDQHRVGAEILAAHPFVGVGPRQWEDAAWEHAHAVPGQHAHPWFESPTPHSDLLRISTELGLLGLVPLLMAMALLFWGAMRRASAEGSPVAGLIVATVSSLLVAAVHAGLDAPIFRPESLALIAVLSGTLRPVPGERSVHVPAWVASALLGVVGAVALGLGGLRLASAIEGRLLGRGLEARQRSLRLFSRVELAEGIALEHMRQGKCAQAQEALDAAMKWSPHHWGPFYLDAVCAERRGELSRAESDYAHVLSFEPHIRDMAKTLKRYGESISFLSPGQPAKSSP